MRRTLDVYETEKCWTCRGRRYKTAHSVQRAVKREDTQLANENGICVTLINWHTISRVGAIVVKVLTGQK